MMKKTILVLMMLITLSMPVASAGIGAGFGLDPIGWVFGAKNAAFQDLISKDIKYIKINDRGEFKLESLKKFCRVVDTGNAASYLSISAIEVNGKTERLVDIKSAKEGDLICSTQIYEESTFRPERQALRNDLKAQTLYIDIPLTKISGNRRYWEGDVQEIQIPAGMAGFGFTKDNVKVNFSGPGVWTFWKITIYDVSGIK
jgi:hypothetical protein